MKILSVLCFFIWLFTSVHSYAEDRGKTWELSDSKINYLLAGDVCQQVGLTEWRLGRKRLGVKNWTETDQVFTWPVNSSHSGTAQVTLLVNIPAHTEFLLKSKKASVKVVSQDSGWQRIVTNLELNKGQEQIELSLGKTTKAAIIGLEVISSLHLPSHRKRISEFQSLRGETAWFKNAGFGLMFQWGYWGYPKQGDRKQPWQRVYQEFDIEAFADKMAKINPGYLIWSITWRGSRFSLPLKSVDEIMGSKDFTMEYDFLGKLADALHKRNIPLFLYYHPGAEEPEFWNKVWHGHDKREHYQDCNIKIWAEIGNHLGTKLAGWFVDGGMAQHYPVNFYAYKKALTAGNPKRLTTCNPWIFPNCSPFDDMSMGENHAPGKKENGIFISGPTKGLIPHTMLVMDGPGWGVYKKNQKAKTPRGGLQYWQGRVDQAKATQHPLSLCILMYEDGSLGEGTESILQKLKR